MTDSHRTRERPRGGSLVAGLILIAVGVGFLLFNMGLVDFTIPWHWWPLIVIAIGAGRLLTADGGDELRGGVWLLFVGSWLLLNVQGWFGLSWQTSWPLMIIGVGLMIVWRGWSCGRPGRRPRRRAGEEAR